MNLTNLSSQELTDQLLKLRGSERETTLKILYYLVELDGRRLYSELGYSSLFDYCLRALRYSEASSARRVAAARALRDNPELAELFLQGKVSLCTIATAAKGLREKRAEVADIVCKSKREVALLVAPVVPSVKERIRAVVLERPKMSLMPEVQREQRYTITFSVTKQVFDEFEQVKSQLSGKLGSRLSVESVFKELVHQQLNKRSRRIKKLSASHSRYIPLSVRQEVRARDGGQCTYISPVGVRCSETRYLHLDHIEAWALGGTREVTNLRLRCACHNLLHAESTFGKKFMSKFTTRSAGGSR